MLRVLILACLLAASAAGVVLARSVYIPPATAAPAAGYLIMYDTNGFGLYQGGRLGCYTC